MKIYGYLTAGSHMLFTSLQEDMKLKYAFEGEKTDENVYIRDCDPGVELDIPDIHVGDVVCVNDITHNNSHFNVKITKVYEDAIPLQ